MAAVGALGHAFEYLTRHFCAVAGAVAQILDLGDDSAVSPEFEQARLQLKSRLELLGEKSTDEHSKLVRSVFYVGATRKTPTPRRHSRLLDLGGIPIRGYLDLGEWIALVPGEKDLANDAKANRELLRYLPILKEWVTATATYYLDAKLSPLRWGADPSTILFDLTVGGHSVEVGPVALSPGLRAAIAPFVKSAPAPEAKRVDEPEPVASLPVESPAVSSPVEPTVEAVAAPTETVEQPHPSQPVSQGLEAEVESVLPPAVDPVQLPVEEEESPAPSVATEVSPLGQADSELSSLSLPEAVTPEISPPAAQRELVEQGSPSAEEPAAPRPELSVPRLETEEVGLSEPPRIEVVGVDDSPEQEPDVEEEPEFEEENSFEDEQSGGPEALDPLAFAPAVDDLLAHDDDSVSLPEVEPKVPVIPVAISPPLPPPPDETDLSDPVVAALHGGNKAKSPQPSEKIELYPVVTGPPPEFFDEIAVDADYPEVLTVAITDLNGAIEANDSILICGQMQRCFDLMIQFFAGLAASVLMEIDDEALFDFEMEDGRFDLDLKVDLIVTALSSLEEHWESSDAANLLWSVFYDTLLPATDPNSAYLHTRLLGVEGLVPEPFIEFLELCQRVPGEGKLATQALCRNVAHHYLPILSFWLENAMPLFLESEIDFVEEDDGRALSWAATVAGAFLDGTGSGFWVEVAPDRWNLPRPELAPVFVSGDAPDVLLPVFEELNAGLESGDFAKAGLFSRVAVDFLIQYFAGCAASLWRQQGEMNAQALKLFYPEASLTERERLLILSLGGISTESEVGQSLHKVFSKGSLQYRALTQRGQPAEIGSLSTWAAGRQKATEAELMAYLPLVRSWIGAANPWFSAGEQLFEEPSSDGILEGVVALDDDFLEMVDPEYVIVLARECVELVAPFEEETEVEEALEVEKADTPFTGQLPQLPILTQGPPVLLGHLGRLLESAQDRRASNAWIGSAFEYLIQYYAGLCTTILGGSSALPREVQSYFSPTASLRERELLLVACIERLKQAATGSVQESVRDIFLKPDGGYREHAKCLGTLGAASLNENEMLLSYWCRVRHQAGHLTTEDLQFGTRVLNSWVEASKPFFASCEHYAEDPGPDGQEEMVVELADDYLDMVMPDYAIQLPARGYYEVLYKESDREALADLEAFFPEDVRPNLVGPQEVVLGGVAGDEGDELLGAAVELGADDLFSGAADATVSDDFFAGSAPTQALDVDDMFAGASAGPAPVAEKPSEKKADPDAAPSAAAMLASAAEADKKRRKKKKKKQELGSAVLELYKKERLEKARKRAEARARKADVEPTELSYTLQYRGLKNSKQLGGRGHFGLIEITNVGGGELKGTVEPDHPCVRVQPNRFEGNTVRVVYQVDPADMPSTGRTGVTIITQDQRIAIRLDRLVPTSWWTERPVAQALALLAAPSLLYAAYLLVLIGVILGPSLKTALELFSQSGLPKVAWGTHLKVWAFAMLAILPGATAIPAAIKAMYARFDYTVQIETRWALVPLMMLPTGVMAAVMYGTGFWAFKSGRLPILASRLVFTLVTFGLNLLASALFSLQTTVWWEDHSDTKTAKRTFVGFWAATILLGVVVTFFMW